MLPEALTKMQLIVGLLTSVSAGVVLRIFYDAYKWMDLTDLNKEVGRILFDSYSIFLKKE